MTKYRKSCTTENKIDRRRVLIIIYRVYIGIIGIV